MAALPTSLCQYSAITASRVRTSRALLENERHAGTAGAGASAGTQLTLFEKQSDAAEGEVLAELRGLDALATTPLDALALLARLSERLRGRGVT